MDLERDSGFKTFPPVVSKGWAGPQSPFDLFLLALLDKLTFTLQITAAYDSVKSSHAVGFAVQWHVALHTAGMHASACS